MCGASGRRYGSAQSLNSRQYCDAENPYYLAFTLRHWCCIECFEDRCASTRVLGCHPHPYLFAQVHNRRRITLRARFMDVF
jgi:hypothetical protein